MIMILVALAAAVAGATFSVPRQFAPTIATHRFVGNPTRGVCERPGCGKPYASAVHHG